MTNVVDPNTLVSFFADIDASSVISLKAQQITAPMVSGAIITPNEMFMGGGVRIVVNAFDRSPSMGPVADLLLGDFNEEYVPAIKDARGDDISALRIAGVTFSSDVTQIWEKDMGPGNDPQYFHPLDQLPLLTKTEYDPAEGWGTALHEAILQAYTLALGHAQKVMQQSGIMPEIDVVVLSDGANNERPHDPDSVKSVVTGSKKGLVRFVFLYFETPGGMADPYGYAINELGFDPENVMIFAMKPGETDKERASRFRRMLRVMSKISASKHTSAVKASAAVDAEDDIV